MKGDVVFVRDAIKQPLVRRVWEETSTTVYACTEERYQKLLKGDETELPPLGFPIEDVFLYDAALERMLFDNYKNDVNVWKRLKRYADSRLART